MKQFFDFISGGFFNYIGAAFRKLFSKEKFSTLVNEPVSNSYGMMLMSILLLVFFIYIRFFS